MHSICHIDQTRTLLLPTYPLVYLPYPEIQQSKTIPTRPRTEVEVEGIPFPSMLATPHSLHFPTHQHLRNSTLVAYLRLVSHPRRTSRRFIFDIC